MIFLFQFMWKERIYIRSARSRNEKRLNTACAEWMNEWMTDRPTYRPTDRPKEQTNEWTNKQRTFRPFWSEISTVKTLLLNNLTLVCVTLAKHWTKISIFFASIWSTGKWFPVAGFACLCHYIGPHGSVLTWKYIWISLSFRSA